MSASHKHRRQGDETDKRVLSSVEGTSMFDFMSMSGFSFDFCNPTIRHKTWSTHGNAHRKGKKEEEIGLK